jgi:hypothetical protein
MTATLSALIERVKECDPSIEVIIKASVWCEVRTKDKLLCNVPEHQLEAYLTGLCHGLEHNKT